MTPAQQAELIYTQEDCPRTFAEDVYAHFQNGYVISTPTVFVMSRPVHCGAAVATIVNPNNYFSPRFSNCWHVYLCAGDWHEALAYRPFDLPFVSWERHNRLRVCTLRKLLDKSKAIQ